ncbi:MAG: hypothetical protein P4K98_13600 [Bryobacteraceae bacterium]|nr:hypothetical protein [Bryobacteraceae bacterium]
METIAKILAVPASPPPSPWSLVLHGDGGEGSPAVAKTEGGVDVSVLSIALAAPKAGQLVEVPPVNQPALAESAGAPESRPEPKSERHAAASEGSAAAPSNAGSHAASAEQAGASPGEAAAHAASQSGAGLGSKALGGQPPAAGTAPVRTIGTPLGRVTVVDLPGGSQQWRFPAGGSFDVVIVQQSPDATIPDAGQFLTCRPVQTVFVSLGTGRDWVLQYCSTAAGSAATQSGMVVTLGPQPKLDAPFIQLALVPPQTLLQSAQPALYQAVLDASGRFARLRPVVDSNYRPRMDLLPYLDQWQFRPAKLDGVPTEVEVLLFVPSSAP